MTARRLFAACALAALTAAPARALDAPASADAPVPGAEPAPVKVSRVKPDRPKLPTLRFLGANRDYLRAELDRLRVKTVAVKGDADAIDPRFLHYGQMLAAARAAGDSASAADSARAGRELFASVTDLGRLEEELDQMDRALADQRTRLALLESHFTGEQRTALAVVVRGVPAEGARELVLGFEDGTQERVALDAAQLDALRAGGAVQVAHRLLEPRGQVLSVGFGAAAPAGWLALEPARDRLNLLQLDLPQFAAGGATASAATAWILDDRNP